MSDQSMSLQEYKQQNDILNAKVSILQNRIISVRALMLQFRANIFWSIFHKKIQDNYSKFDNITMKPEYAQQYSKFQFIIKPLDDDAF